MCVYVRVLDSSQLHSNNTQLQRLPGLQKHTCRLNTIIDSDRVLVLDRGTKLEYDTPKRLLDPGIKEYGAFASMVDETGPENAAHLRAVANGEASAEEVCAVLDNAGVGCSAPGESKSGGEARPILRRSSLSSLELVTDDAGENAMGVVGRGCNAQADHALATLRDLVNAVGSGGTAEDRMVRELASDGMNELSWLKRLQEMLVKLNVLVEEHLDDLVKLQKGSLQEAHDLAGRVN